MSFHQLSRVLQHMPEAPNFAQLLLLNSRKFQILPVFSRISPSLSSTIQCESGPAYSAKNVRMGNRVAWLFRQFPAHVPNAGFLCFCTTAYMWWVSYLLLPTLRSNAPYWPLALAGRYSYTFCGYRLVPGDPDAHLRPIWHGGMGPQLHASTWGHLPLPGRQLSPPSHYQVPPQPGFCVPTILYIIRTLHFAQLLRA